MSLGPFLSQVNNLQILAHYLFKNNFYYFPPIYACFSQVVSSVSFRN
jgi:hypothetical protein